MILMWAKSVSRESKIGCGTAGWVFESRINRYYGKDR